MNRFTFGLAAVILLIGACAAPRAAGERDHTLSTARPGQVVRLDPALLDEKATPVLDVRRRPIDGPALLLSDKPEYFRTGDGIALRERVEPGRVRLYVYHVPDPNAEAKVISAVIENLGDAPLMLLFDKHAFPEPSGAYHHIAKSALRAYFDEPPPAMIKTLMPGQRMPIDETMDATVVGKDDLVHGLYEFRINQPAEVTVFERDPDQDSRSVIDGLPELPRVLEGFHPSGAGRGRFDTADFEVAPADDGYVYDTAEGPTQIILADGQRDPWVRGVDSLSGLQDGENKGNYGVFYRLRVPWRSGDGRGLAVVVYNARAAAQWCGRQYVVVRVNEGVFPGGTVAAPEEATTYGGPPEAALLQRYEPGADGAGGTLELTFSPPGACCLPAPILLIPYER